MCIFGKRKTYMYFSPNHFEHIHHYSEPFCDSTNMHFNSIITAWFFAILVWFKFRRSDDFNNSVQFFLKRYLVLSRNSRLLQTKLYQKSYQFDKNNKSITFKSNSFEYLVIVYYEVLKPTKCTKSIISLWKKCAAF